jgi:hypothetical protein
MRFAKFAALFTLLLLFAVLCFAGTTNVPTLRSNIFQAGTTNVPSLYGQAVTITNVQTYNGHLFSIVSTNGVFTFSNVTFTAGSLPMSNTVMQVWADTNGYGTNFFLLGAVLFTNSANNTFTCPTNGVFAVSGNQIKERLLNSNVWQSAFYPTTSFPTFP